MSPRVSFVIPCFNLARFLPQCVDSISCQTFSDFEILILDDCSPDETEQVVQRLTDNRVVYVRNEINLGHLRNYNKGIGLARGKYIWLLSPDDSLRGPDVLNKYVALLEQHSRVGYVFSPVMDFDEKGERFGRHSFHGDGDQIFPGPEIVKKLMHKRCVPAASGMARRECYEKFGAFPLDLPFTGDEYLWALFALHYDVGYFSRPMVNYRIHEGSMTSQLREAQVATLAWNTIAVPWRIKEKAQSAGCRSVVRAARRALVLHYAEHLESVPYRGVSMSIREQDFLDSVTHNARNAREGRWVRARVFARQADIAYWKGDYEKALDRYARALREDVCMPLVCVKYVLLRLGNFGIRIRGGLLSACRRGLWSAIRQVGSE
jgi:glycosyltransferase involved in cell wall biosynthesis